MYKQIFKTEYVNKDLNILLLLVPSGVTNLLCIAFYQNQDDS